MHDSAAELEYSKMRFEHLEEGNSCYCTPALCTCKRSPVPSSPDDSTTRSLPLRNKLRDRAHCVLIFLYDRIILLSLHRRYLRRLQYIRYGTGPQPRVQAKVIVRDKAAAHAMKQLAMKQLNNEVLRLCAVSFVFWIAIRFVCVTKMQRRYIARVPLAEYMRIITIYINATMPVNTFAFLMSFFAWVPTILYRLVIRANPSELNEIARTLASLPALLIWCTISVFVTLLLASLQSWLPSPMEPPDPASQKLLAIVQNDFVVLLYIAGLKGWLLTARLKFVAPLLS